MKKLIAMFLAALTALSLTACAAKSGAQPDASEIPDALTILNTVWASYSEDEKFPAAGGDYSEDNMTDGQPGTVGLENASDVEYLLSIPASVVAMADDGASLFHMMNGNTFTCGALRLTDAGKLDEAAKEIKVFQTGNWLIELWREKSVHLLFREWRIKKTAIDLLMWAQLLRVVGLLACFGLLAAACLEQKILAGALAGALSLLPAIQEALSELGERSWNLQKSLPYTECYFNITEGSRKKTDEGRS